MSEPLRILITGGTGFVGSHLVERALGRGDRVTVLSRSARRDDSRLRTVQWDPEREGAWMEAVAGHDVVVHLAGEQAVGMRYTPEVKRRILDSRVVSTNLLVQALGRAEPRPRVFVCASGAGFYGARLDAAPLDETAAPGSDFLAEVTVAWEGAAARARDHGVRVVSCRLGIVLGPDGGALSRMALPFRLFVGGPIASGEQCVSWVHVEDAVNAILRCIDDASISGPVNVTAPRAATQRELSAAIGSATHRPSWLPVPAFGLRLLFGEGALPLVTGQNAVPAVLQAKGFQWRHPDLREAVQDALQA